MIIQPVSEVSRRCVVVVSLQRQGDEPSQTITGLNFYSYLLDFDVSSQFLTFNPNQYAFLHLKKNTEPVYFSMLKFSDRNSHLTQ